MCVYVYYDHDVVAMLKAWFFNFKKQSLNPHTNGYKIIISITLTNKN